jgi:hypothetical protein
MRTHAASWTTRPPNPFERGICKTIQDDNMDMTRCALSPPQSRDFFSFQNRLDAADEAPRRRAMHLHEDLAREMDMVGKLFQAWVEDVKIKRAESLQLPRFEDFETILMEFNRRGERRCSIRTTSTRMERNITIQDYYFVPRRQSSTPRAATAHTVVCTRCHRNVARHARYYVDIAKRRAEADRLCFDCISCVMQRRWRDGSGHVSGDGTTSSNAAVGWGPSIDVELAELLLGNARTSFS